MNTWPQFTPKNRCIDYFCPNNAFCIISVFVIQVSLQIWGLNRIKVNVNFIFKKNENIFFKELKKIS